METLLVLMVVAVSAFLAVRSFYRSLQSDADPCGGTCGAGCGQHNREACTLPKPPEAPRS
jgi:hypothetical protein